MPEVAVITILVLIYTFIFAIRCPSCGPPPHPLGKLLRGAQPHCLCRPRFAAAPAPAVAESKLRKEAEGECMVCLSVFGKGEEVKQHKACSHYLHAPCIDAWLSSHANCPVCRTSIAVKRPPPSSNRSPEAGTPTSSKACRMPPAWFEKSDTSIIKAARFWLKGRIENRRSRS